MPRRSMSPSSIDSTLVSVTPRTAAMLPMPAVRQVASACSTHSTGVGAWSLPHSTAGWSPSAMVACLCMCSPPAPVKVEIVVRLLVPRHPAVRGAELELGQLRLRADGVDRGEQRGGVDPVARHPGRLRRLGRHGGWWCGSWWCVDLDVRTSLVLLNWTERLAPVEETIAAARVRPRGTDSGKRPRGTASWE